MTNNNLTWRKSHHSNSNGDCVEVATTTNRVFVRDSKHPGPFIGCSPQGWGAFLTTLTRGESAKTRVG